MIGPSELNKRVSDTKLKFAEDEIWFAAAKMGAADSYMVEYYKSSFYAEWTKINLDTANWLEFKAYIHAASVHKLLLGETWD